MRYIIDRFEGDFAVCEAESNEMIDIQKQSIPKDAKEGDVLVLKNSKYIIDKEQTKIRKENIIKDAENLWQ